MLIDLIKMFPKSCAEQGITALCVEFNDIKYCRRTQKSTIGFKKEHFFEDSILVSQQMIRFPSIDKDGIETLSAMIIARNVIDEFQALAVDTTGSQLESLQSYLQGSRKFLSKQLLKYATDVSLDG